MKRGCHGELSGLESKSMDENFVQKIKERLTKELAAIEPRITEIKKGLLADTENTAEEIDRAQAEEEKQQEEAELNNLEREKGKINHTLGKIEQGKFGLCEKCANPIDPARLETLPTACLCMDCKLICDNCGVEIEEARITGRETPKACQNCQEEFEPEITYTSSLRPQ